MLRQSFRFKAIVLPREGFSIPNFAFGTKTCAGSLPHITELRF